MNRWHRALQGFGTDLIGTGLVTIAGFIATPIILSLTSQDLYGFWVITLSVMGYLALSEFGIGIALTRQIASDIERRTPGELNALIASALACMSVMGTVLFVIGFGCSFFVSGWFDIPAQHSADVVLTFRVAVFAGAIAIPMSVFGAIVGGSNRMALDNVNRTLVGLSTLVLSIILLQMGVGLVSLAIGVATGSIMVGLVNAAICRQLFPQISIGFSGANLMDLRKIIGFGATFQIGRIANTVALTADSLVIGARIGAAVVTPYVLTLKLANLLSANLASKIPAALFPALSGLFGAHDAEAVRRAFVQVLRYSIRLAACAASFVVLANQEFVTLWVGAANYAGMPLTIAFATLVFFDSIYRGIGSFVYASGDLTYWATVSGLEAVANLGLCIVFASFWGIAGVAWATVIARGATSWWLVPWWLYRKMQLGSQPLFMKEIMLTLLRACAGIGIGLAALGVIPVQSGWLWIVLVGACLGLSNILVFEAVDFLQATYK